MSIFRRVSDIIAARIGDLLEQAEDREAMADRMIREMERYIVKVRRQAAEAVAAQRALERKAQGDGCTEQTVADAREAARVAQRLQAELHRLEDCVQEARSRRSTLLAKRSLARARRESAERAAGGPAARDAVSASDVIEGFERLQAKIEREADEAAAWDDLAGRGDDEDSTAQRS